MSDNQCAVCFDHGDSSGAGPLLAIHQGCLEELERERENWHLEADAYNREIRRANDASARLEAVEERLRREIERRAEVEARMDKLLALEQLVVQGDAEESPKPSEEKAASTS